MLFTQQMYSICGIKRVPFIEKLGKENAFYGAACLTASSNLFGFEFLCSHKSKYFSFNPPFSNNVPEISLSTRNVGCEL
jgi:hypothetical protein